MPYKLQVSCIVPANGTGRNAYIEAVGGKASDGAWWFVPQQEAIAGIERGRWAFFVKDEQGVEHELGIAQTEERRKYLTCEGEVIPELLLRLHHCQTAMPPSMH